MPSVGRVAKPDKVMLERMLYFLKLTREAEWKIEHSLYRQGKIVGGVYVGRGQEAIGVGTTIQLVEGDVVIPTHRDFSAFVIRGMTLPEIFSNWMGRAAGPTRGRDAGPHLGDVRRGIIAITSQLGSWCPVACGVGLAMRRRGTKNVTVAFFGEGTTSRGDVHEAMNFAAVTKLPVIFVCSNNAYAYSTPTDRQYAVKSLATRGPCYGMPGESVDGNDVLAVHAAVAKAVARARSGGGPSFVECRTFRMAGHSAHDMAEYVPEKLRREWAKKDPIEQFERYLLARRILTRQRIQEMEVAIREEIDNAVAEADSRPMPRGGEVADGVYCEPACWWARERRSCRS